MYGLSIRNFEQGFIDYLNQNEAQKLQHLSQALAEEYAQHGGLHHLAKKQRIWHEMISDHLLLETRTNKRRHFNPKRTPSPDQKSTSRQLAFDPRLLLLDQQQQIIIGNPKKQKQAVLHPVKWNNEIVAYLGVVRRTKLRGELENLFILNQQRTFTLVLGILLLLSAAIALPLASTLVSPIGRLVRATNRLISGEYTTRIEIKQRDELGALAEDFNNLAKTLDQNRQARQRWIADISHELRTPLAVLKGEIEAIQDGIRSADSQNIASLAQEVNQINALVDDLYQLTLSDQGGLTYKKSNIVFADIIIETLNVFDHQFQIQNIKVTSQLNFTDTLLADEQRLRQLIKNLIQNTLRYTDNNGALQVILEPQSDNISLIWQDSSPGVNEKELPRLLERLYRSDGDSRNRQVAGSGLGLSICKNIVDAHQGEISAQHSPLGGLKIVITLPFNKQQQHFE